MLQCYRVIPPNALLQSLQIPLTYRKCPGEVGRENYEDLDHHFNANESVTHNENKGINTRDGIECCRGTGCGASLAPRTSCSCYGGLQLDFENSFRCRQTAVFEARRRSLPPIGYSFSVRVPDENQRYRERCYGCRRMCADGVDFFTDVEDGTWKPGKSKPEHAARARFVRTGGKIPFFGIE